MPGAVVQVSPANVRYAAEAATRNTLSKCRPGVTTDVGKLPQGAPSGRQSVGKYSTGRMESASDSVLNPSLCPPTLRMPSACH